MRAAVSTRVHTVSCQERAIINNAQRFSCLFVDFTTESGNQTAKAEGSPVTSLRRFTRVQLRVQQILRTVQGHDTLWHGCGRELLVLLGGWNMGLLNPFACILCTQRAVLALGPSIPCICSRAWYVCRQNCVWHPPGHAAAPVVFSAAARPSRLHGTPLTDPPILGRKHPNKPQNVICGTRSSC